MPVWNRERYYLDSNTIVAIVGKSALATPAQRRFIEGIDSGAIDAHSSDFTLAECLVRPMRQGDTKTMQAILDFLDGRKSLPLVPITRNVLVRAAEIRALDYLKMPDAIHLACAGAADCTVFVSADKGIRMPKNMRRIAFDEITAG